MLYPQVFRDFFRKDFTDSFKKYAIFFEVRKNSFIR